MKWPHASLTDEQVRGTFFVPPELPFIYALALGEDGYRRFRAQRRDALSAAERRLEARAAAFAEGIRARRGEGLRELAYPLDSPGR